MDTYLPEKISIRLQAQKRLKNTSFYRPQGCKKKKKTRTVLQLAAGLSQKGIALPVALHVS